MPHAQRATDGRSVYQRPGEWETSLVVVVGGTYTYVWHARSTLAGDIPTLYRNSGIRGGQEKLARSLAPSRLLVEGTTIFIRCSMIPIITNQPYKIIVIAINHYCIEIQNISDKLIIFFFNLASPKFVVAYGHLHISSSPANFYRGFRTRKSLSCREVLNTVYVYYSIPI